MFTNKYHDVLSMAIDTMERFVRREQAGSPEWKIGTLLVGTLGIIRAMIEMHSYDPKWLESLAPVMDEYQKGMMESLNKMMESLNKELEHESGGRSDLNQ